MILILLTAIVAIIGYAIYKLLTNTAQYFEERNLKYAGPISALKDLVRVFFGKSDFLEWTWQMYNAFPNEPIYGSFDFSTWTYIVRDPEAYKQIAVKDFDHFTDRRPFADEKVEELWGNSLISLRGEKWRQMRATLSPAFTGSKMRQMSTLVSECADDIVKHFSKKLNQGETVHIEMKDFFSRYANDVIATCAFGLKVNSFDNPDNEFMVNGKKILNFGGLRIIVLLINMLMPKITNALGLKIFDQSVSNSLKSTILDTMATRKQNHIFRPDMINLLMEAREGNLKHQTEDKAKEDGFATVEESDVGKTTVTRTWNDNEVVAQCLIFFFAGFETSSTVLTFAAYELVANPDVQEKLYDEIANANEQIGFKQITYDALQKMKYLDQVVCETLRKWTAAAQIDRLCIKDYVFDDGKKKFVIEKGSVIVFPLLGIQRDPKYFPNPERFDPERFSDENKENIVSGTYVPFGVGPRNCIGSRFALMEVKAILYYLLLNFSFVPNEDTQIPLKLKKGVVFVSEKGVHLELRPRKTVA